MTDTVSSEHKSGAKLLRRADLGLSSPWEQPKSEEELKLAEIWRQVMMLDAVGTADDFFELGGDSFMATTIAAEIEATFGVEFAPGDIINLSTIAEQARAVTRSASTEAPRALPYIVVGRAEGSKPALFMVHGAAGFSFFNKTFLDEVGQDRPVYLFQAPGLDGRTQTLKTVEEIAGAYVASMRKIQPTGPYHIAAMCAGSFIALEMCNQLAGAGQTIARLILLDPPPAPQALTARYPTVQVAGKLRVFGRVKDSLANLRRMIGFWLGRDDPFEKELRKRAKQQSEQDATLRARELDWGLPEGGTYTASKMRKFKRRIVQVQTGEIDWTNPELRSYSPDAMLEASLRLYEALKTYVPRPYAGKAVMLVRSSHAPDVVGERSFWRDHLDSMECREERASHKELFAVRIGETARFVRDALEPAR
jgi:thioesterase domain-containing protein/acyl carrier protein